MKLYNYFGPDLARRRSPKERIMSQRARWSFHYYNGDPYSDSAGPELGDEELWELIQDNVVLQFKIELQNRALDILCWGSPIDCDDLNIMLNQFDTMQDQWTLKVRPRYRLSIPAGTLADYWLA